VFSGRYEYGLDEKSRVSIPARFRETLSAAYDMRLILTNHADYIVAYPYKEWVDLQEKISTRENMTSDEAAILRFIRSGAVECPIDKLGRVLISPSLKTYAAIKKNVMVVGNYRKIEIWALEKWDEEYRRVTEDRDKMQQVIARFGL
jgi:MraZ protein